MNLKMLIQPAILLLLLMPCVGCAHRNNIDLIQGKDVGFCGTNPPPSDCIWFSQQGWNEMATENVNDIKKSVSP